MYYNILTVGKWVRQIIINILCYIIIVYISEQDVCGGSSLWSVLLKYVKPLQVKTEIAPIYILYGYRY